MNTHAGRESLRLPTECHSPPPMSINHSKSSATQFKPQDTNLEDIDNDDEEMLHLRLQEIQARIKLKRMQNKMKQTSNAEVRSLEHKSRLSRTERAAVPNSAIEPSDQKKQNTQANLEVPVSPIRKKSTLDSERSPDRVLLRIDKGLKSIDVTLSSMPVQARENDAIYHKGTSSLLQRYGATSKIHNAAVENSHLCHLEKPLSFSEKLAAVRRQDKENEQKALRIRKSKSATFNINQDELQNLKGRAVDFETRPRPTPEFSRDEVMKSFTTSVENFPRSKTTSKISTISKPIGIPKQDLKADPPLVRSRTSTKSPNISSSESINARESEASQFEPYSSQHLKKRIIPHQNLTRLLAGKKTYLIPDLLREVKAPDFSSPDIEEDLVLLAIIASKSEPKVHRSGSNQQKRGKFLAFTLTDLKWELDFFLFDSAFEKFWKMTPGTILAILNPLIMPPPPGKSDTGKFNIMLNSNADTILEIGTARDLGFCKSVKRDGRACKSWVDKRHSEFCNYHVNYSLSKTHAARMEVNTMGFGKGKYNGIGDPGNKKSSYMNRADYLKGKSDEKSRYDLESHSQIFIGRKSTVSALDDVDFDPDAFHRGSTKEERMMRRILSQEKERNLEKRLAVIGSGLGAEYARVRQTGTSLTKSGKSIDSVTMSHDAKAIGILDGKVKDVTLSPVKRKRSSSISVTSAKGWGRNLSQELERLRTGKKLIETSVHKRTRFLTEQGIKEAGRESLSGDALLHNNSDDDLDIIKN